MQYEDRMTIATPEGVELELTLAGLGSRFVGAIIDHLIKAVLIVLLIVALVGFGDLGIAVLAPLVLLAFFAYDVLFEVLSQGRTPGKRWTGIRVVRVGGAPVDVRASAIRNLLRLVDEWLLWFIPGIVSILVTEKNQRLGDLAANTVVVRDRRAADTASATLPGLAPPPDAVAWDVTAVGADDLATVREFLMRRSTLPSDARARVAGQLYAALHDRVGGATPGLDAERFLEGVAAAKLARERG
jgi:uncharacterized RDD family membrane protein YckC